MKNNWDQQVVANSYSDAIGEYGDFWRQALVNATVLNYAKSLAFTLSHDDLSLDDLDRKPCHIGMAEQRKSLGPRVSIDDLVDWHQQQQEKGGEEQWLTVTEPGASESRPLRILDLGCGEGYLGRWLSSMGAQYWGVDSSAKLLTIAKKKSNARKKSRKDLIQPVFIECDLDGASFKDSVRASLTDQIEPPDLIVITIVLDHLDDPNPLMMWLRQLQSNNHINSRLLIFSLNIDYFFDPERTKIENDSVGPQGRVISMNATIDSAKQQVEVRIRPADTMERIFRDCGFRIVQYAPLHFSHGMQPKNMERSVYGIPPFNLFTLAPYPVSATLGEKKDFGEALLSGSLPSPLEKLSEPKKKHFREFLDECEIFELQADETLFQQHNIGGDVFVVLTGSLDLVGLTPVWGNDSLRDFDQKPLAEREIAMRTFEVGELIGDLETAEIGRESYFIFPVRAGSHGATVLRIPHRHVSAIIDDKGFTADLFKSLQKRVLHLNLMHIPHGREKKWKGDDKVSFPQFPWWCKGAVTPLNVARVVSGLLSLAEIERQTTNRDCSGRSFLADVSNVIFRKTGVGIGTIQEIMRILVGLGAVDAFALADLRKHFVEEWEESSKAIVAYGVSDILEPEWQWGERDWDTIKNQIAGHPCFMNGLSITRNKGQDLTDDAKKHLRDYLLNRSSDVPEWLEAIERYLRFIWTAGVWWTSQSPMYFRLNDLTMLKRLIFNDEREIDQELNQRFRTTNWGISRPRPCPSFKGFVNDETGYNAGRILRYLHHAMDFIHMDVTSNRARLNYSGQETGALPPVLS